MLEVLFPLVGGIGLFLIGMMLLSQGLTTFAGDSLRRALMRFTGTPVKAFVSGAVVTLLIQSSTATTVTLIGFVSAGLIPFSHAVGVVMGASLGTTATGWMIAGLGLKVNLGFYSLPLIGVGAMLRLLGPGRWAGMGNALAGFGILFVGLAQLQEGMRGVTGLFDLAALPVGGLWAHLVVMLIGVALTTLLQSSTAAVATTLTALHTATINMEQATALVIGAAIGTTLTGALAAIGATRPAKRTALAHILFNSATGLIAIVLLPLFLRVLAWLQEDAGLTPGALSLAAFHTLFIAVGVVVFLPWAAGFARLIERLLPDRDAALTRYLDASVLSVPGLALVATERTLGDVAQRLFLVQRALLENLPRDGQRLQLQEAERALGEVQAFFARIPPADAQDHHLQRRLALMHAMDHVQRLLNRLQVPLLADMARTDPACQRALVYALEMVRLANEGVDDKGEPGWLERLAHDSGMLARLLQQSRADMLQDSGRGVQPAERALRLTDTLRWLDRSGHHVWRIAHYLQLAQQESASAAEPTPTA